MTAGSARVTRYTPSCVTFERDGMVLVTHEHSDPIEVLRLAGLGVPVYAPAGARITGLDVTGVDSGQSFTAAGFHVTAVGARHAPVFQDAPDCANYGYIIDDRFYHPGDALFVPDQPIQTLVPLQASWLKTAEAISFLRAVGPRRAFSIAMRRSTPADGKGLTAG